MKKNNFLKDKNAIFIGTSVMLEKCIEFSSKKFKNIYVITDDKKIIKKFKNRVTPLTINEFTKFKYDYLFSILNYKIIPNKFINSIKQISLNFHDGPLPKYAGLFSSTWAIANGDKTYGVTWHKITKKIDAGDIAINKKFKIKNDDTSYNLDIRSIIIGINLFKILIKKINKNNFSIKKQILRNRTYYGKTDIKYLIKKFNLDKDNRTLTRAFTLSPQKNRLLKKITGKKINILKKDFKKTYFKNSTNIDLLKLINFLGKVINFKFNANKINNNKLKELSLNNHPKWDSLAHVKLLSAFEKNLKYLLMKLI